MSGNARANDYLEEQENEIEALRSIYPDEFKSEVTLKITYTDTYPDELPEFTIIVPDDSILSKDDKAQLKQTVQLTAEESLGMAMVFSMTSMLKDTLDDILIRKKEAEEQAIQAKRDKELEAEQAKFIGTRTTKETFM
ncbi:rwd domain-containing protein, partial [Dimargaris xerosporica]